MPQIPQPYLDCSIYLYESRHAAEDGENFGGSGCLVSIEPDPIYNPEAPTVSKHEYFPRHIYAVTNKHVVENGCPVVRLNTIDGNTDVLELNEDDWIFHPEGDDLAIASIDLPAGKHDYIPISTKLFAHRDSSNSYIGAGDDTFMVGRFINHSGQQRNTPSLRFGSIAMMPFEKIKLENGYMQEAFLVETRSISGYSGSPVFVYKPFEWDTRLFIKAPTRHINTKYITDLVGYIILLGIDCGHIPKYDDIVDASGRPHSYGWKVLSNTGMAIVIPAWRLHDLLSIDRLAMQRKTKDEKYRKEKEIEKLRGRI